MDGSWGWVCDDGWDSSDGGVLCQQLFGRESKVVVSRMDPHRFYAGVDLSPQAKMSNVACTGSEPSLLNCDYTPPPPYCELKKRVALRCSMPESTASASVALRSGSSHEGWLTVLSGDGWGTVCDDGWGDVESDTACRTMFGPGSSGTASSVVSVPSAKLSSLPIVMSDVRCTDSSHTLLSCAYTSNQDCSHLEDIYLRCTAVAEPTEAVRLVGGRDAGRGQLQLFRSGRWGSVCNSGWQAQHAEVVCQQLFGTSAIDYDADPTDFPPGRQFALPIGAINGTCSGDIQDCPLNSDVSCTEDSFVATVCDYDASGDAGSSAAVIGTVTGVSLFAILAVAAGFIFLRRRRSKGSDNGDSGAHAAEEREMVAILSSDGTVSGDGIHSRSGQAAKLADAI
eukprot:PLAT9455.2.p1 GENE.PLAT9455.2~~PLAT9455.2.p1  ORF type:complete len:396 (+),score=99.55 PLAT9455.2:323-1510(+)